MTLDFTPDPDDCRNNENGCAALDFDSSYQNCVPKMFILACSVRIGVIGSALKKRKEEHSSGQCFKEVLVFRRVIYVYYLTAAGRRQCGNGSFPC